MKWIKFKNIYNILILKHSKSKILVYKETVVLCQWEIETDIDFTVKDLESRHFEHEPFIRVNRGIVGVVGFYVCGGALPLVVIG